MKVKCPLFKTAVCDDCGPCAEQCEISVEISTADLVAELERRRPCGECFYRYSKVNCVCNDCVHRKNDNFKAKEAGK